MQDNRVELRLHTTLSGDISLITPRAAILEAVRRGLKAIAITDRNSVQSFYAIAGVRKRYGKDLKVIYGAELCHISGVTATVLVKDQEGLKPLYKLISGRAITPEERTHLLFGAYELSPLYAAMAEGAAPEVLRSMAQDYDYLQLTDRKEMNQQLCQLGTALNKPVIAAGNCHYLYSNERIGKQILDAEKGDLGAQAHLYTTEEMLARFAYLGEEAAYRAVVTEPNRLAAQIGKVEPDALKPMPFTLPDADARVRQLCQEKMLALYGPVPAICQRLEQELSCIGQHMSMFLLCHLLAKHIRGKGGQIAVRGTAGSSLVAWLLDISNINPLPAHYHCPDCASADFVPAESGLDLPERNCPHCGRPMVRDGQNIPCETCFGLEGEAYYGFDLTMSEDMRKEAKAFLGRLLGKDRLAAAGMIMTYSQRMAKSCLRNYTEQTSDTPGEEWITNLITGVKRRDGVRSAGIFLLPEGMEWEDITPVCPRGDSACGQVTHFEYYDLAMLLPHLRIGAVRHFDRLQELFALTHTTPEQIDYSDRRVYDLFANLDTAGVPEFSSRFAQDLLALQRDLCFSDLVRITSMAHGTNVWKGNGEALAQTHDFRELISDRDQVFLTLRSCGVDRQLAYRVMKDTRMGKMCQENPLMEQLAAAGVPQWYLGSMNKILYLFPRAHAAACCKLAYALAWFKVYHPEAFYKVMLHDTAPYTNCSLPGLETILARTDPHDLRQMRKWEKVSFLVEAHRRGYC